VKKSRIPIPSDPRNYDPSGDYSYKPNPSEVGIPNKPEKYNPDRKQIFDYQGPESNVKIVDDPMKLRDDYTSPYAQTRIPRRKKGDYEDLDPEEKKKLQKKNTIKAINNKRHQQSEASDEDFDPKDLKQPKMRLGRKSKEAHNMGIEYDEEGRPLLDQKATDKEVFYD